MDTRDEDASLERDRQALHVNLGDGGVNGEGVDQDSIDARIASGRMIMPANPHGTPLDDPPPAPRVASVTRVGEVVVLARAVAPSAPAVMEAAPVAAPVAPTATARAPAASPAAAVAAPAVAPVAASAGAAAPRAAAPLAQALLASLPPHGAAWSADQRLVWLTAAASVFDVMYGADESVRERVAMLRGS